MGSYPIEYLCELVGGPRNGEHMVFPYKPHSIRIPLQAPLIPKFAEDPFPLLPLHPRVGVYKFAKATGHLWFYTYRGEE